ncbi:MAG TPA: Fic family protein [Candidatus Paceibacterota bacterium]
MDRFRNRIKINQGILKRIAAIDEFKGLWHGSLRLSPQILGRLRASVLITSTGASTRIEGSKLEDEEVARLLKGLHAKAPKGRDEEEVAGYADLLGRILDNHKTFKITEGQVLQFHQILLHFSKKDHIHKGNYKSTDNVVVMRNEEGKEIVMFRPTPPHLVKKEMDDILFWTHSEFEKKELHPILLIANFIFEFLAIHPFKDGNGRMSRALTNLLMLQSGYTYIPYVSMEEIIEERKVEYYLALRATQKNHKTEHENITPWAEFFLDVLIEQTKRARNIMELDQPEKLLSEKQLRVYSLFEQNKTSSKGELYKLLEGMMPEVTIRQALSRLTALKLIERIGQGRSTRYRKI